MNQVRIEAGNPTPEELAVVLTLLRPRLMPIARTSRSWWGRPILRQPLAPGQGAWRHSAR
jgi:hypothetical protein